MVDVEAEPPEVVPTPEAVDELAPVPAVSPEAAATTDSAADEVSAPVPPPSSLETSLEAFPRSSSDTSDY